MKRNNKHIINRLAAVGLAAVTTLILVPATALAGQAGKSPVKVFILAGQSNMEGAGATKFPVNSPNGGKGTLRYLVKDPATAERFKHTVDAKGEWVVRDDVWIWYLGRKGGLSAGYGAKADRIGPEFQFGHAIGAQLDNQVLLIKTAWGGKSLQKDFRPPGAVEARGGEVGPFYTEMIGHIKQVLADLQKEFPDYDGNGYELAGFGWHQGWNDGCSRPAVDEYEENLVSFIKDVRKDLGVKDLPFVIADSGFGGRNQTVDRRLDLRKAQKQAAERPEFKGTVTCVETSGFFRAPEDSPSRHGFHWNCNAETYFLIGDAMAGAMVKLMSE
jgi:alpha-galactosidase